MSKYIERALTKSIKEIKRKFPILAITGPRQSGKTTFLKNAFEGYEYVSLENPDIRSFAINDPNGFLDRYNENIILDEVQRAPELFSYLQTRVDNSGKMGQYILSGSQNFYLMKNIGQTLAGRIALFKLFPFDFTELKANKLLEASISKVAVKGFYPAIFNRSMRSSLFYNNYIQTYIERDIPEIINIQNIAPFRTFVKLCAHNAGQLLNISNIATSAGISHSTARAWLSILQSSYIVFLLQPYYENFKKRLVKSPKLYFYDTGLLCHLLEIENEAEITENRLKGNIFENMVIAELIKENEHKSLNRNYYFWRDSNGHEIDLLYKKGDKMFAFEIKSTQTIKPILLKHIDYFEAIAQGYKVEKHLIYSGKENQNRTKYKILSWAEMD